MDTWLWILIIAAAALIVLALVFFAIRRGRTKQVERKRAEATQLRTEAEERLARAGQREAVAQQEAERAERERAAAEYASCRAVDVDPDVSDVTDDREGGIGALLRRRRGDES